MERQKILTVGTVDIVIPVWYQDIRTV